MDRARDAAEVLALQVLGWLAGNDALLPIFQGATGVSEGDMREGAADPAFLASVVDFVLMDDAWVVQCCDTIGQDYGELLRARPYLPGGEQVNWT